MPTPLIEREITAHVSLTTPDGALNHDALGWSRVPVHDTSGIPGRGHWGRNKRWGVLERDDGVAHHRLHGVVRRLHVAA